MRCFAMLGQLVGPALAGLAITAMLSLGSAWSQEGGAPAADSPTAPQLTIKIAYLGKAYQEVEPLSLLDNIYTDKGIQGARIGLSENNMTGRLIGQHYESRSRRIIPEQDDIAAKARELLASGVTLIVADLEPADLLAVADLPEAKDAIVFNVRSSNDHAATCRTAAAMCFTSHRAGPCAPMHWRNISSGRSGAAGC